MVRIASVESESSDGFTEKVRGFIRLKQTIADLTKESNALRDELAAQVDEVGEVDDSGSKWVSLPDEIDGVLALKRERRVAHRLEPLAAEAILSELGLVERCYTFEPVLDQDELMACVAEGLIDDAQMAEIFPSSVTWAFVTKK